MVKRTNSQADIIIAAMQELLKINAPHSLMDAGLKYMEAAVDKKQALNDILSIIKESTYPFKNLFALPYHYTEMENNINALVKKEVAPAKKYYSPFTIPDDITPHEWKCDDVYSALNEEWRNWDDSNIILLRAPTGLGKNYFVEHSIIEPLSREFVKDEVDGVEFYRNPNILILSNRIALNIQNKINIATVLGENYIYNFSPLGIQNNINKIGSVYVFSYHQYLTYILNKQNPKYNDEKEIIRSKYTQDLGFVSTLTDRKMSYVILD